jgi:hypothetical protein
VLRFPKSQTQHHQGRFTGKTLLLSERATLSEKGSLVAVQDTHAHLVWVDLALVVTEKRRATPEKGR